MDIRSAFSLLGLSPMMSVDDGKKRYRELCKEHHPDKGGDAEKFKQIVNAWELVVPFLSKDEVFEAGVHRFTNGSVLIVRCSVHFSDYFVSTGESTITNSWVSGSD